MSQGLVSVIMGTYDPDCGKLKKSVESIIAQTYENWELLLYDDGSKKEKAEKIRMISRMDPRIKYIRNNRNKGLAYALNVCISRAEGEYIARMDDDDEAFPERFEKQIAFSGNKSSVFLGWLCSRPDRCRRMLGDRNAPGMPGQKRFSEIFSIHTSRSDIQKSGSEGRTWISYFSMDSPL